MLSNPSGHLVDRLPICMNGYTTCKISCFVFEYAEASFGVLMSGSICYYLHFMTLWDLLLSMLRWRFIFWWCIMILSDMATWRFIYLMMRYYDIILLRYFWKINYACFRFMEEVTSKFFTLLYDLRIYRFRGFRVLHPSEYWFI